MRKRHKNNQRVFQKQDNPRVDVLLCKPMNNTTDNHKITMIYTRHLKEVH